MVVVKISGPSFAPGEVDEGSGIDEERETERRSVDVSFKGAAQQLVDDDVGDGRCLAKGAFVAGIRARTGQQSDGGWKSRKRGS